MNVTSTGINVLPHRLCLPNILGFDEIWSGFSRVCMLPRTVALSVRRA